MTDLEKIALAKTAELWNAFMALPDRHPDDTHDVRFHIHAIQHTILARPTLRSLKEKP